jgi:hypothetical protein
VHTPLLQTWLSGQDVVELQLTPPVPQVRLLLTWHCPWESQQPFAQLVLSQTQLPLRQRRPVPQLMHRPLVPQAVSPVPGWQLPSPAQQPLGQGLPPVQPTQMLPLEQMGVVPLHDGPPQLISPPQTFGIVPQVASAGQVLSVQPQTLAVPALPPPQLSGALQVPQSISVPQLLAIWSQLFGPHGSTGAQQGPSPF